MHPIFAQRERFMLYMAAWLVIGGLLCLLFVMMEAFSWSEAASLLLPMALVYSFMCLASLYVCRSFPLQETPFAKVAAIVAASSFLSAALWLGLGKGFALFLTRIEYSHQLNASYDANVPLLFGIGVLLFLLGMVIHYLLLAFDSARAAERRALESEVLAREAELKALRSQIQPHFLFNSLNSISALTASNPPAARTMSLKLAEFFRQTLKLGQDQFIQLEEEFRLAENFLSIERARFGDRLAYRKEIAEGCEHLLVPSLILQPIVENAVGHGIAHLIEGGSISLEAERNGERLKLTVTNPRDPDRPQRKGTGVGLANIKRRLESLYGDEARLSATSSQEGFRVEIVLPMKHTKL